MCAFVTLNKKITYLLTYLVILGANIQSEVQSELLLFFTLGRSSQGRLN